MLLNWTKELLKRHDLRPNKRLGQNFLINEKTLQILIDAIEIKSGNIIVEVGAGVGTVTLALAKKAKSRTVEPGSTGARIIAVEKDKNLIPILKEVVRNYENVEIVHGDILKIENLEIENWKLVGNIPYYITAPLIRRFLEMKNAPEEMILMVQKEMAQRIAAYPPDMSILAVSVQIYATAQIISFVPKNSFWPQPNVDSAIIKIKNIKKPDADMETFFKVVKSGFSSPRKQLLNNLSHGLKITRDETKKWLAAAGIDESRRAETLMVIEWIKLAQCLKQNVV